MTRAAARTRPHLVHLAIDARRDIARHIAQDLLRQPLRFRIELADEMEMARHLMESAHRIMRRHRLIDRGVVAHRKAVGIRHVNGRGALVDQPFDERFMDRGEDRIAGNDGELIMEGDIGADELRRIAECRRIGVERFLKPRDVLIGHRVDACPVNGLLLRSPACLGEAHSHQRH